jgi:hypothetical protein
MKQTKAETLLNMAATAGILAVGGLIVGRVYKKQSLAAKKRRDNPNMTYHESIVAAWKELGYEHPFKL